MRSKLFAVFIGAAFFMAAWNVGATTTFDQGGFGHHRPNPGPRPGPHPHPHPPPHPVPPPHRHPHPHPRPIPPPDRGIWRWEWSYLDHNGCHSCYACDSVPCDRRFAGQKMACHRPGTDNDFDVYICHLQY